MGARGAFTVATRARRLGVVAYLKIAIASDHGGFALKESLKKHFGASVFTDFGTQSLDSVDYPDFAREVATRVASGTFARGILICGTGIGISIAANKIKGIRAALCHDVFTAEMARKHNDANILALGGRVLDEKTAIEITDVFLHTDFEGGRHQRRLDKISALET
ncbi:MAG: ribose 5-phosphate isomerase B [Spirochaetes bacterium]|nr:ribose 5-phosphate isomerase B [Spirochaetota bacterium]